MNKIAYIITTILYFASGVMFGYAVVDMHDPVLWVLSIVALIMITLGFVLTTLLYFRCER